MAATREGIFDRIGDILDTISVAVIPVKYRYPETKPSSFPASMLIYRGATEREVDTTHNLVTYRFSILTVYPVAEAATAYNRWLQAYDTIVAEFRKDDHQTLSGDAVRFMVEADGQPTYTDQFSQQVAVLDIRVFAEVLQSIAT